MIPYIHIPSYKLFGLIPIQPFGVLVGIGLVLGYFLARRRARLTGLDPEIVADAVLWVVVSGFIVAHLVSVIFYFPHRVRENPFVLLAIWSGLSSFGGFVGGIIGALIYFRRRGVSVLEYVDVLIFGFVPGWIFGRMGCSVVHDHPGTVTDFVLGVHCPAGATYCGSWGAGTTRHDLGLYELGLTILLTLILYALKNVRPFRGFHPALMLFLYSPVRFAFDFLRTADRRYFGLTAGQYLAVAMFGFAVALTVYGFRLKKRGIEPKVSAPTSGTGAKKRRSKKRNKRA